MSDPLGSRTDPIPDNDLANVGGVLLWTLGCGLVMVLVLGGLLSQVGRLGDPPTSPKEREAARQRFEPTQGGEEQTYVRRRNRQPAPR